MATIISLVEYEPVNLYLCSPGAAVLLHGDTSGSLYVIKDFREDGFCELEKAPGWGWEDREDGQIKVVPSDSLVITPW